MSKFKRYIKNIFSIAGVEWNDGSKADNKKDGIVISEPNSSTASDRSNIADRQYLVSIENFVKNNVLPLIIPIVDFPYITNETGASGNRVGNLPAGMPVSFIEGKSFREITDLEFFVEPPRLLVESNNRIEKNSPGIEIIEVGASLSFDVTVAHVTGLIVNGNSDPSVKLQGDAVEFNFTNPDGSTQLYPGVSNLQNHITPAFPAVLGANIVSCDVSWAEGVDSYFDAHDNVRYEFNGVPRFGGNEIISETIEGLYAVYYASGIAGSAPIDPIGIRDLDNSALINGIDISYLLPAGDVEFYFYIPDTMTAVVLHEMETNTYITTAFVQAPVPMEDAGGAPIGYTEWKFSTGGVGYINDAVLKIKII